MEGTLELTFTDVAGGALLTSTHVTSVSASGSCMSGFCSCSGSFILGGGCYGTVAAAVGNDAPAEGAMFAVTATTPTPAGSGLVTYTESCGTTTRRWVAGSGGLRVDRVIAPPAGTIQGKMSMTILGAQMAASAAGSSTSTGTFVNNGTGNLLAFTASPH